MAAMDNGALLVLHDAKVVDAELAVKEPSFFQLHGTRTGYLANVVRNLLYGMLYGVPLGTEAVHPAHSGPRAHARPVPLAFWPEKTTVRWNSSKEPLLLYRQHGDNVTGHPTSTRDKLRWRADILRLTLTN